MLPAWQGEPPWQDMPTWLGIDQSPTTIAWTDILPLPVQFRASLREQYMNTPKFPEALPPPTI